MTSSVSRGAEGKLYEFNLSGVVRAESLDAAGDLIHDALDLPEVEVATSTTVEAEEQD